MAGSHLRIEGKGNWRSSALPPEDFECLVSMLAMVIGWEPFIVLFDVRALTVPQARETCQAAAMLDAFLPA